ncbi:hypothetical protein Q9189_007653 [Teloschistes chrysophthalmus]
MGTLLFSSRALSQTSAQYGYNGPGIYRIISPVSRLPIGFNTSTDGAVNTIISVAQDDNDISQRWLIAEVSRYKDLTTVVIVNEATGGVMLYTPCESCPLE